MTPLSRSRFSDLDRDLQARFAITGNHKVIASQVGVTRETISQYAIGTWPIPAFRAFRISAAQGDWTYLRALAMRAQAVLFPRLPDISHWSGMQLLAQLVIKFGEFLPLAEKIRNGEPLTPEELIQVRDQWEQIKQAGDAILNQAEQRAVIEQAKK